MTALVVAVVLIFVAAVVFFVSYFVVVDSTTTIEAAPEAPPLESLDADGTYRVTPKENWGGEFGYSGPVILDLTHLTPPLLVEPMTPTRWGVEAEGRVEVIVPEGVRVAVEALAGSGSIEVFGQTTDSGPARGGFPGSAEASYPVDDPEVELVVLTWTGDIKVRRG